MPARLLTMVQCQSYYKCSVTGIVLITITDRQVWGNLSSAFWKASLWQVRISFSSIFHFFPFLSCLLSLYPSVCLLSSPLLYQSIVSSIYSCHPLVFSPCLYLLILTHLFRFVCCFTESGKKAFIQSDGIKILYSLSLESLESRYSVTWLMYYVINTWYIWSRN